MSITEKIPGMTSGSTVRNIIVLLLYFFLLPLIVISLPIIMGLLVARNYGGWADTLTRLPGISTAGGWKSGISAAVYMFGILLLFGAVTDGSDENTTDSALEDNASDMSADTATSGSSDETGDATSEPEDSSSEDDGTDSGADTNDPPESSSSDGTDGTESSDESTADSPGSESDTEDGSSGAASSSTQRADDESTPSEPSSEADEPEPTDDSEPQSTASVPSEVSGGEARHATVTRVIDGDTMEVEFADGEEDTVRLIGVDTPETTLGDVNPEEYEGIPDTPAARDHLYNWGQQASQYATDELEGQEVRVVTDPEGDRRGSYGRLLAYLYIGDENFNRTLLENGYAQVYDSSFSLREEFDSAEAEARSNDVALWDFEDDSASTATESDSEDTSSSSDDSASDSESESDSDDEVDLPPVPADGDYDCGHFDTQEQAQYVLEDTDGDPHRLDADDDGIACETLP